MIPRKLYKGEKFGSLLNLWNQLIDHLAAMRLVAGKGVRISYTPGGVVVDALPVARGRSAAIGSSIHGGFVVSLAEETGKLDVTGGFVCVNGQTFVMKKQQIDIQSGLLCVKAVLDEKSGKFADPVLEYGEFDEWHYPVAEVSQNENSVEVLQYPVTVAMFMLVKTCVFAKAASNGK